MVDTKVFITRRSHNAKVAQLGVELRELRELRDQVAELECYCLDAAEMRAKGRCAACVAKGLQEACHAK